ncbi:uncharacterized protein VTP21DRAFT_8819 [Calcarisporiella thermophila]|uniref:uncharacterized protein n=1 Tax=Calcarisporiella thermophila TaxID=911321 RepID=UPI0037443C15
MPLGCRMIRFPLPVPIRRFLAPRAEYSPPPGMRILVLGSRCLREEYKILEDNHEVTYVDVRQLDMARDRLLHVIRETQADVLLRTYVPAWNMSWRFDEEFIASLPPSVRLIALSTAGAESTHLRACRERGILVSHSGGANSAATADTTLYLLLSSVLRMPRAHHQLSQGRWSQAYETPRGLSELTLGIVGMGHIGKQVAYRAKAFGLRLHYYSPTPLSAEEEQSLALTFAPLDTLLRTSDVITLHVPLTRATYHLIDAAALAKMKRGAVLINTSRGKIVDEEALVAALESEHLGAVGLDVYEHEPHVHPGLLGRQNATLLPHIASFTSGAFRSMERSAIENVRAFAETGKPLHPIKYQEQP